MHWLLNTLLYPLRMACALAIIALTAGFSLAAFSWGFGAWLGILLVFATVQYSFSLIDASARGQPEPPNVEAITLNPLYDRRPAFLVLTGLVVWGLATWLQGTVGDWASRTLTAIAILLAPAVIASMAATGRAARALSPWHMISVAVSLGGYYLAALAGFALIALAALSTPEWGWPLPLRIAGWLYLYFLFAHVLGVMIYQGRDRVGFEPDRSPERDAEAANARHLHTRKACLSKIYQTASQGTAQSLALIDSCAATAPDPQEAKRWFFEQLITWPDAGMVLAFARPYIDSLMRLQQVDAAFSVCEQCLAREPRFRPALASDTIALAQTAQRLHRYSAGVQLLGDYATRFPQDPAAPAALLNHATLAFRHTGQATEAFASMRQLLEEFPSARQNPQVMALARELQQAHRPSA